MKLYNIILYYIMLAKETYQVGAYCIQLYRHSDIDLIIIFDGFRISAAVFIFAFCALSKTRFIFDCVFLKQRKRDFFSTTRVLFKIVKCIIYIVMQQRSTLCFRQLYVLQNCLMFGIYYNMLNQRFMQVGRSFLVPLHI